MPIRFYCECGKRLSAPNFYAGREGKCESCGRVFKVPAAPPPASPQEQAQSVGTSATGPAVLAYQTNPKAVGKVRKPGNKRDYTYLVFLLAMLPLIWKRFLPEDAGRRLDTTLARATPEAREKAQIIKEDLEVNGPIPDHILPFLPTEFYDQLPRGKIDGALLSRRSKLHWLFAVAAAGGYLALILTFFPRKTAEPKHLLYAGAFTGTVGILLLLSLQALADATRGWVLIGGGIGALPFWLLKLVAGSYDAALDANANLFVSAFGFIACVGLLEETVKAIPLIWHYNVSGSLSWRAAILWGMASGIGFGVNEAIAYSGDFYNGIQGVDIYVVRFISTVALHAIWTASTALFVYQQRDVIEAARGAWDWISATFGVVIIPTFLHGLYDTMLKKEFEAGAIVIAAISFGVLAMQIEHLRKKSTVTRGRAVVAR